MRDPFDETIIKVSKLLLFIELTFTISNIWLVRFGPNVLKKYLFELHDFKLHFLQTHWTIKL